MSRKAEHITVIALALVVLVIGQAFYQAKPLMLYVVAMFGGSYQYEPAFFFAVIGGVFAAAVLLSVLIERLFYSKKAS